MCFEIELNELTQNYIKEIADKENKKPSEILNEFCNKGIVKKMLKKIFKKFSDTEKEMIYFLVIENYPWKQIAYEIGKSYQRTIELKSILYKKLDIENDLECAGYVWQCLLNKESRA